MVGINMWTLGVSEHSRNTSKNRLRLKKELDHKQQSDFLASAHPLPPLLLTQIEAQRDKVHACILLETKAEVIKERTRNQELRWGQAVETQETIRGTENFSEWTKEQRVSSSLTTGNLGKAEDAYCSFDDDVGVDPDDDDGGVGGGVHPRVLIYADCRTPDGALNPPGIPGR